MADSPKVLSFDGNGPSIIVEIVCTLIAKWEVDQKTGAKLVQYWRGSTDDPNPDVAPMTAASLKSAPDVAWYAHVLGLIDKDSDYGVTVTARQGTAVLDTVTRTGKIAANKSVGENGSWTFQVKK